jgi:protein-ribulosamine 3-kinase
VDFESIEQGIAAATGKPFQVEKTHTIAGGCINEALCLEGAGQRYFLKHNCAQQLPMFEAEAAGLEEILRSASITAPRPVASGTAAGRSWLALEYVRFGPTANNTSTLLGEQLAAMHRHSADQFGWQRDNTIGATPQPNPQSGDWVRFLAEQRLGFQLSLARDNGAGSHLLDQGERLVERLPRFFDSYTPCPSLLHGDLWGGNWSTDESGNPVIFDPAVYYGDREADLAMTELFGGFDDRFYQSYRSSWDIDPGYATRKVLYNLYHILNHFNLFGGGYAQQAEDMIDQLNAEVS